MCRTWSVPSHIPLPPLYLRRVAPTGAQHREGRKAALTEAGPKASLCQLFWLKNTLGHGLAQAGFLLWLGKWSRLSTVDLVWLSGRANNVSPTVTAPGVGKSGRGRGICTTRYLDWGKKSPSRPTPLAGFDVGGAIQSLSVFVNKRGKFPFGPVPDR